MFSGTLIIAARTVKPKRRILLIAVGGLMMSVASIVGPIVGGVLTAGPGWRYCFIINLPASGVLMTAIILVCKLPPITRGEQKSWLAHARTFDFHGATLVLGTSIMLFLALHDVAGGRAWSNVRVIGLLLGSGLTTIILVIWLWYAGEMAIVPLRFMQNRAVASASLTALGTYGGLTTLLYFLPIYFEAADEKTPEHAAIALLPYILACAISSVIAGIFTTRTALPQMTAIMIFSVFGCTIAIVGAGLLSSIDFHTPHSRLTGFQIVYGLGMGIAIQQGQNALQFALHKDDIPIAMTLVQFYQALGGAVGASIGNAVFLAVLRGAKPLTPPGVTVEEIITEGEMAFRRLPIPFLPSWMKAFSKANQATFLFVVGLSVVSLVGACFMTTNGWRKQKKRRSGAWQMVDD
jgi:MFS family permease